MALASRTSQTPAGGYPPALAADPETVRAAQLTVIEHAHDTADARRLLQVLGIDASTNEPAATS
ncbi:hypothetical protein [Aeromicrobium sp. CTD01-1L150]|uniref:hypothetical protein n=1 Tax=Aeromicrobium sp. CTD01-1L150 TaxID=3341830 RepID=UPI0035C17505